MKYTYSDKSAKHSNYRHTSIL